MHYDERELVARLEQLPPLLRAAFAAACAQRLLPAYVRFSERTGRGAPGELTAVLERLWRDLEGKPMGADGLQRALDHAAGLIPDENEGEWAEGQAQADDAAAAVAYAVRCRQTGEAQDAGWAGRRAYEALDHLLRYSEDIGLGPGGPTARLPPNLGALAEVEWALVQPLIQAELARQRRDLDDLLAVHIAGEAKDVIPRIRDRAKDEAETMFG